MGTFELVFLAIGLAMDAFAVAVCKGLSVQKIKPSHLAITGLYFGGFQAMMPLVGYFLGINFRYLIERVDHWIAFVLLLIIGANMLKEAFDKDQECMDCDFGFKSMLPMAVATSIDALAVGVTFAFLKVDIWLAITLIGIITFALSAVGVYIGKLVGLKLKSKAEIFGGIVLILIGLKILLEHLEVLNL